MSIIQSKRTFGIELEMGAKEYKSIDVLRKFVGRTWRFDDDGSIRHVVPNPTELVSPILTGEDGEKKVREICAKLKELDFDADHLACGFHVHMGADEFKPRKIFVVLGQSEFDEFVKNSPKKILGLAKLDINAMTNLYGGEVRTNRYRELGRSFILGFGSSGKFDQTKDHVFYNFEDTMRVGDSAISYRFLSSTSKEERKKINVYYDKLRRLAEKRLGALADRRPSNDEADALSRWKKEYSAESERINTIENENRKAIRSACKCGESKYVVMVTDTSTTDKLISAFLFYLIFDRVFLGMLPKSRRDDNAYCMPISSTFSVSDVLKCKSQEDFERLWYKENNVRQIERLKGEHYNDSRYHDVNIHSLFNRHGTIEIRSHGSTIDAQKILLWTALHQRVIDMVADGKITKDKLAQYSNTEMSLECLANDMIGLLELPTYLVKYVKRLLNYYSNTKL